MIDKLTSESKIQSSFPKYEQIEGKKNRNKLDEEAFYHLILNWMRGGSHNKKILISAAYQQANMHSDWDPRYFKDPQVK